MIEFCNNEHCCYVPPHGQSDRLAILHDHLLRVMVMMRWKQLLCVVVDVE